MKEKKMTIFSSGLIWFGAAVSIAEILTGTLIAPLGLGKGLAAIILGHVIGCILLYLAALIGANTEKSAMDTVKGSFGKKGSVLFSVLNIIQLVGWTAVMIIGGARAAGAILNEPLGIEGVSLWCILIGILILIWIFIGIKNISKINIVAMSALFLCTIILSGVVFRGEPMAAEMGLSFGLAVELSAAMPLSWLPLISDYVKAAEKPKTAASVSTIVYFITSCWMYTIGLGAAIFTGQSDIAQIMLQAGLGLLGVIIIIFSTVTTTFLDVYSAGVSFVSITDKVKDRWVAMIVCVTGTLLAIFTPIEQYENFLYFIGSVFAPMTAILITDYFILKKDHSSKVVDIKNLALWAAGFIIYRLFMSIDTPLGSTLPVMAIISILCIIVNGGRKNAYTNS
ncbi:putative hydroxymethylpyrimidine transporter CytX [Sinanaerobacter chloroacetimidivorans]|uniref:Putative hydroxymethylpyrimidine transporter CytX n=1 Tax=Sinanaerobacter chloroacetimidivorans TaxID=2818044 RepID=A0A8J8B1J4_9FIRM|nr:putative hydroxymethylpyrimidine transporter CytX [Sinanaerobacter chloroacetimidivorans]MBR0596305.1 putative hydroxymethylpyrimidine transporter CytX [Sinanaerobacter chloroacetimidivorans]